MAAHRLYGVFAVRPTDGRAIWGLYRSGAWARRLGRQWRALVLSMPLPGPEYGAWDAPTFRVLADRVEGDWRQTARGGK